MKRKMLLVLSMLVAGAMVPVCEAGVRDSIEFASTIKVLPDDSPETIIAKAAHVVPTPNQLRAMDNEFIAFVHFGPNTFTRKEWGTGMEDPAIFAPTGLDTDQWAKAMADAGMKMVILTVKHHDGFVLWQSRYTDHGVMSSPFMDGKGDILKSLSESAHKYGLKLGIYLSPADLYQIESPDGLYGNLSKKTLRTIPREVEGRPFANKTKFEFVVDDYNEYFLNQLFELLTEYGPVDELWFDGAHPKRKGGQTYDYIAWKKVINTLAPQAVIFGKEDARWCGNEAGRTRDTEWNVMPYQTDPDTMNLFGDITAQDLGSRSKLMDAKYLHYQYPEIDTSIREGWFFRDDNTQRVRNADDVFDIYERAAGGNGVLLLNIPPGPDGRFGNEDLSVLAEVGRRIRDTYGTDLLAGAAIKEISADECGQQYPMIEIALPSVRKINRIVLKEPISVSGERIEEHAVDAKVDGEWRTIAISTNIGHKRTLRFPDIATDSLRVRVLSSRLEPAMPTVSAHYYKSGAPQLDMTRGKNGYVKVTPKRSNFNWHGAPKDAPVALLPAYTVHYTLDGSEPTLESQLMPDSLLVECAMFKARAFTDDEGTGGATLARRVGYVKGAWNASVAGNAAFDENESTAWKATAEEQDLLLDLGESRTIGGIAYTPAVSARGAISRARVSISNDGSDFREAIVWNFGNLTNDPSERLCKLPAAIKARYVKITPLETADGQTGVITEIAILPPFEN